MTGNLPTNLILTATLQVKNSVDQMVPLLDMAGDEDPDYKPVAGCYKTIQTELGNASELLKRMK